MSSNTNYEKEMVKNIKMHTSSDGKFHASDSINLQFFSQARFFKKNKNKLSGIMSMLGSTELNNMRTP
jgi:hypothetical protein